MNSSEEKTNIPQEIEGLDSESQRQAKEYARLKRKLLIFELVAGGIILIVVVFSPFPIWLRETLSKITTLKIFLVALYYLFLLVAAEIISFPLSYYRGFILPHRYKLSTQDFKGWFKDSLKMFLLKGILGLLVIEVVYYLLGKFYNLWWIISGILFLFFTIILANLLPTLILPMFFKFTPLEDKELEQRLINLCERAGVKVIGAFKMGLSAKTKAANAALAGIGNTRRILLGDTLLENFTSDEIETVIAHEVGHHLGYDIWRLILIQAISTFVALFFIDIILKRSLTFFHFQNIYDIATLPFLAFIISIFSAIISPLVNSYSRVREALSDKESLGLTEKVKAFKSAMYKLANQNLSEYDPPRWVEYLLYDHPSIKKRIEVADNYIKRG